MSEKTTVAPQDAGKKNSPIAKPAEEESTVTLDGAQRTCHWNDVEFADGSSVCCEGKVFECSLGHWVEMDESC